MIALCFKQAVNQWWKLIKAALSMILILSRVLAVRKHLHRLRSPVQATFLTLIRYRMVRRPSRLTPQPLSFRAEWVMKAPSHRKQLAQPLKSLKLAPVLA